MTTASTESVEQVEREYQANVDAAARGDAAARARLPELRRRLQDARQHAADAEAAAADVESARARAAAEQGRRARAGRRAELERERAEVPARILRAGARVEELLTAMFDALDAGRVISSEADHIAAALAELADEDLKAAGRPPAPRWPEKTQSDLFLGRALGRLIARAEERYGTLDVFRRWQGSDVPLSLSPASKTATLPPDTFAPRQFPIGGPNVRQPQDQVLPTRADEAHP